MHLEGGGFDHKRRSFTVVHSVKPCTALFNFVLAIFYCYYFFFSFVYWWHGLALWMLQAATTEVVESRSLLV